jgi:transposase-like protein
VIPAQFRKLLSELEHLTDIQVRQVKTRLKGDDVVQSINVELEQRMVDTPECPLCHSSLINWHGNAGSMQRYRCKNCLKTFTATTDTPLARLRHKEKWHDYLQCMISGKVLRESAKECGISLTTSFRWRHRFLRLPAILKTSLIEG